MKLQSEHYYNPYFEYLVQSGFFFFSEWDVIDLIQKWHLENKISFPVNKL